MKNILSFSLAIIVFISSTLCASSFGMKENMIYQTAIPTGGEPSSESSEESKSSDTPSSSSSETQDSSSEVKSSSTPKSSSPSSSSKPTPPPASSTPPTPPPSSSTPTPPPTALFESTIMGTPVATVNQLVAFYWSKTSKTPKLTESLESVAFYFLECGRLEGVRGDIAFFQAILETGYFQYGNDVKPEQNNFCGLGATGGGNPGHSFPNARTGVLAQIQHLKGYATSAPLNTALVDPRYKYTPRNVPSWVGLSGKWASPGYPTGIYSSLQDAINHHEDYGSRILKLYAQAVGISY